MSEVFRSQRSINEELRLAALADAAETKRKYNETMDGLLDLVLDKTIDFDMSDMRSAVESDNLWVPQDNL